MVKILFDLRLQELMNTEKISKRKLSIGAQVERKSISMYLEGICLPRYDALARISDYFEVSSDFLLGLEKESFYCYKTCCNIDDIPVLFISRLKSFMLEHNLSQGKLSKLLNIKQPSISKWLKMKTMPETPIIVKLAEVFDCSVDYFIGREQK